MYAQDAGDPHQRRDVRIRPAGFDVLVGGAAHLGGQEHALLGAVLVQAGDADAVADGAALLQEPVVVIGQVWHATTLGPIMIASQPGSPGLL
jgi:hypothetical protein